MNFLTIFLTVLFFCSDMQAKSVQPISLLRKTTFDVIAKYIYAKHFKNGAEDIWASGLYTEHLKAYNKIIPSKDKKNVEASLKNFRFFLDQAKKGVFKPCIILGKSGSIHNGRHRTSVALAFNQMIDVVQEQSKDDLDITASQLKKAGLKECYLDEMALEYSRLKTNAVIGIVWPQGIKHRDVIDSIIEKYGKIVYEKGFFFNLKGGKAFLSSLPYKISDAQHRLRKYFPPEFEKNGKYFCQALLCEIDGFDKVIQCKREIRRHLNIDPFCIHMDDDHEQVMGCAEKVFNNSTLSYFNSAVHELKTPKFQSLFSQYCQWTEKTGVSKHHFCIDGSGVLAIYGIRDITQDLDFIYDGKKRLNTESIWPIDFHNDAWMALGKDIRQVLYNPTKYFYYQGQKILNLTELSLFKKQQGRPQDLRDISLINQHQC